MSWDDTYECPVCGNEQCVPMVGDGKIMLLGSFPGRDEIAQGTPYVGGAGEILRTELAFHGLDMYGCRLGNLWLHEPNKNDECLAYSVKKLLKKAKKCKAILLLGAQSVKYFTGYNVSAVNGLKVKSEILSAPIVMACVQSATVFHGPLGEFRLAIRNFVQELERNDLL